MKVIALGMGMQSTALYLMSSMGQFERADHAIFSDPMAEHPETYKLVDWLLKWEKENDGIPIHIVKKNLYKDLMNGVNHRGRKFVSIPAHGEGKLIKRQCTYDYKILPVMKKLRELHNLKPRKRMPLSEMWLGITIDEASRMKDSREPRIKNRYPFMEMMMNRSDCMHFMRDAGFPVPVKSSCVFCPYHSNSQWKEHKKDKIVWDKIIEVDEAMRWSAFDAGMSEPIYLHPSLKPIDEADLGENQIDMFENECEGHCGL